MEEERTTTPAVGLLKISKISSHFFLKLDAQKNIFTQKTIQEIQNKISDKNYFLVIKIKFDFSRNIFVFFVLNLRHLDHKFKAELNINETFQIKLTNKIEPFTYVGKHRQLLFTLNSFFQHNSFKFNLSKNLLQNRRGIIRV
eukprot:snap_masked-scaffold_57-processed-gene-1.18-mRNA-1 protein AED:1.00 eAED:1.00 QI:0/0/0/0/1/1/2/0/141